MSISEVSMARDFGAVKVGKNGRALQFAFVEVSPSLAQTWLNLEHPDNRHSSRQRVIDYSTTMDAGKWNALTAECLKFNVQGQLIDGAHRLRAVMAAGKTVTMLVAWGLPDEAYHALDQGRTRSKLWWEDQMVAATVQSLVKFKDGEYSPHRSTQIAVAEMIRLHRAQIIFSCDLFATKRVGISAMVRAIVARSSYHATPELLEHFSSCLYDREVGDTVNRQHLIGRLGKYLVVNPVRNETMGQRYRKINRALKVFIDDSPVSKLHEAPHEFFPLPEEEA
jgi:hypothetical protein